MTLRQGGDGLGLLRHQPFQLPLTPAGHFQSQIPRLLMLSLGAAEHVRQYDLDDDPMHQGADQQTMVHQEAIFLDDPESVE
jgi:hypothetical protein